MITKHPRFRGVYIRPSTFYHVFFNATLTDSNTEGLVYHAHHRPLTTPAAAILDLCATLHRKSPPGIPTPSSILRSLGSSGLFGGGESIGSPLQSIADALAIPPIHVDHVADAICAALDSRNGVQGVVNVRRMRELIGWSEEQRSAGLGLAE